MAGVVVSGEPKGSQAPASLGITGQLLRRRRLIIEALAQRLVVVAVEESVPFHYLPIA